MTVLLDTHVFVWLLLAPDRLDDSVMARVSDPSEHVLLSVASAWEIAIKSAIGKLEVPEDLAIWLPDRLQRTNTDLLPIAVDHALRVATLPMHHRDPFDRLLIAQAHIEKIPIVTADRSFAAYDIEVISPTG